MADGDVGARGAEDPAVRALKEDCALLPVAAGEVIRATGADRVAFLHRVLTSDVAGLAVGGGQRALLLSPKGHIVADFRLCLCPEEVRLVVAPGQGAAAAAALSRYAVMDDFQAAVDPTLVPIHLHGPRAAERLAAAGLVLPPGWDTTPRWGHHQLSLPGPVAVWVLRAHDHGTDGVWLFTAAAAAAALRVRLATAGVSQVPAAVAEGLRVMAGEPAWGTEIGPDFFPMEVGLDGAIDYSKGCYLGQEPIVRIRDRGRLNRRLVRLSLGGEVVPAAGDLLESEVRPQAGRITSAGQVPGRPPAALGLLHASVPEGMAVRVRHGEAALLAEVAEAPPAP